MIKLLKGLFLFFFLITATFASRPFIIDTDVGIDDVMAMLYMMQRPDIDIKAITIASDGNAECKSAFKNTLGLLTYINYKNIPVACGRSQPLFGTHKFPRSIINEENNLSGTAKLLPKISIPPVFAAEDLLITTIKNSIEPVEILAIGPLTNIATALAKDPSIKAKIKMIYVMGGAINVTGNIHEVVASNNNTVAEWNIYLDPLAASKVFKSGVPVTLIPLDITNKANVDIYFYETLKNQHITNAANFVYEIFARNQKLLKDEQWYFWDPLAAVIATNPELAKSKEISLHVVLIPETLSGQTVVDEKKGAKVNVVTEVNTVKFKEILLSTLNSATQHNHFAEQKPIIKKMELVKAFEVHKKLSPAIKLVKAEKSLALNKPISLPKHVIQQKQLIEKKDIAKAMEVRKKLVPVEKAHKTEKSVALKKPIPHPTKPSISQPIGIEEEGDDWGVPIDGFIE